MYLTIYISIYPSNYLPNYLSNYISTLSTFRVKNLYHIVECAHILLNALYTLTKINVLYCVLSNEETQFLIAMSKIST